MYEVIATTKFKKDYKRSTKRNLEIALLDNLIMFLGEHGEIPIQYKPHILKGKYTGHWECHIKPDWLLIWLIDHTAKEIILVRTGTHSDLFD